MNNPPEPPDLFKRLALLLGVAIVLHAAEPHILKLLMPGSMAGSALPLLIMPIYWGAIWIIFSVVIGRFVLWGSNLNKRLLRAIGFGLFVTLLWIAIRMGAWLFAHSNDPLRARSPW